MGRKLAKDVRPGDLIGDCVLVIGVEYFAEQVNVIFFKLSRKDEPIYGGWYHRNFEFHVP